MKRSHLRGLTLLEIAFAIGLAGIVLAGLFSSMASSMRVGVLTREHQAASEACSRELDRLLGDPSLAFANSTQYFDVAMKTSKATDPLLRPQTPLPPGYAQARTGRIEVVVNPVGFGNPGGLGPDCVRITVSVAWRGTDGKNSRVDLVSLKTR